jgi:hypothetical protein
MGTWRRPKGSYVRNTADWNIAQCASVGGAIQPSGNQGVVFDLFNNATDGSSLHVYEIFTFTGGDDIWTAYGVKGHSANFVANASAIVIGNPGPWGALYYGLTPSRGSLPFDTVISAAYTFWDVSAIEQHTSAPGPLMVVPPGYSMRVDQPSYISGARAVLLSATFYFVALPDQG